MPGKSRSKSETRPGQWLLYGVFVVAGISLYFLIKASLRDKPCLDKAHQDCLELRADVMKLKSENSALREQILELRENPEFEAERRMRTEFKWARKGEWIYLIDEEPFRGTKGRFSDKQIQRPKGGSD